MTVPLIDLMTAIYFTNHRKRQFVKFLKEYPCIIYAKNYLECEFEKFSLEYRQTYQCLDAAIH